MSSGQKHVKVVPAGGASVAPVTVNGRMSFDTASVNVTNASSTLRYSGPALWGFSYGVNPPAPDPTVYINAASSAGAACNFYAGYLRVIGAPTMSSYQIAFHNTNKMMLCMNWRANNDTPDNSWSSIAAGNYDTQFNSLLDQIDALTWSAGWPQFFLFTFDGEFGRYMTGAPSSVGTNSRHGTGPQFVAAWKHLMSLRDARTGHPCKTRMLFGWREQWYWISDPTKRSWSVQCWPGDSFVDVHAPDLTYNKWSTNSTWKDYLPFIQDYYSFMNAGYGADKQIIETEGDCQEWGSTPAPSGYSLWPTNAVALDTTKKAQRFRDYATYIAGDPQYVGFANWEGDGSNNSFPINTSSAALTGWTDGGRTLNGVTKS